MLELTRVKELTPNKILREWWVEVKEEEEDFWDNTERHLKNLLKQLMESTMEEELLSRSGTRELRSG